MRQSRSAIHTNPFPPPCRKGLWLGLAAGVILRLSRRPLPDATGADLKRHDYSASTQRIGVCFTERIRAAFRFRWIREIF
jgi:hypothetical protein